jgi:hypothetical protein
LGWPFLCPDGCQREVVPFQHYIDTAAKLPHQNFVLHYLIKCPETLTTKGKKRSNYLQITPICGPFSAFSAPSFAPVENVRSTEFFKSDLPQSNPPAIRLASP